MLPSANCIYNCHNPKGTNLLLTRLLLNLSHLRSHKFKHSFQDSLNPLYTCGLHEESISYFLLHCPSFPTESPAFLSKIRKTESNLLGYNDSVLTHTILFG